jgi:hypothetical protein
MHRPDLADRPGPQHLGDLLVRWVVAIVEGHGDRSACAVLGVQDPPGPVGIDRHRLLGDDLATGVQPSDDVAVVGAVDSANHHDVDALLRQHRGELTRVIGRHRRVAPLAGQGCVVDGLRVRFTSQNAASSARSPYSPPRARVYSSARAPNPTTAYRRRPALPSACPTISLLRCVVSTAFGADHRPPASAATPRASAVPDRPCTLGNPTAGPVVTYLSSVCSCRGAASPSPQRSP